MGDGDRLTAVSPTWLLALIRAALTIAGVQRAAEATLKMFRAGHATTMAAAMAAVRSWGSFCWRAIGLRLLEILHGE